MVPGRATRLSRARAGLALAAVACAALLFATPVRANGWEHAAIPFDVLVRALSAKKPSIRAHAAESLGLRGQKEAVPPLLQLLGRDEPSHAVRRAVYVALGRLDDHRAIGHLRLCLKDEARNEIRVDCASALGALGRPEAVADLLALLQAPEPDAVNAAALAALGRLGTKPAVDGLIDFAATTTDRDLRLRALVALGDTGAPEALKPLLGALTGADPAIQFHLVGALGRLGASEAVEPLTALLEQTEDPRLRLAITAALGAIQDGSSLQTLVALLGDPTPAIRYLAIRALLDLGDPRAARPLAELAMALDYSIAANEPEKLIAQADLATSSLKVQIEALRAVTVLDPPVGTEALLSAAGPLPVQPVSADALMVAEAVFDRRRVALYGLGYTASADASALLAGPYGIDDPDFRLRATAVRSLGVLGLGDAATVVLPALSDEAAEVRWTAARVLGLLGDEAALPALNTALKDRHGLVRAEAARAIGHLGAHEAAPRLTAMASEDESAPARAAADYALHLLAHPHRH